MRDNHSPSGSLILMTLSHLSGILTVVQSAAWFAKLIGTPLNAKAAFDWWQENVSDYIALVLQWPLQTFFGTTLIPKALVDFLGVGILLGVSFILGLMAARRHHGYDTSSTIYGFAQRWQTWSLLLITTILLWPLAVLVFLILALNTKSAFSNREDIEVSKIWMWLSVLPIFGVTLVLCAYAFAQ